MANGLSIENPGTIDDADDKPGNVILTVSVEAGHFGRLTTDQRTACLFAPSGNAFDNGDDNIGVEPSRSDVVHEEKRPCALHKNVVHAVIDEIRPDRIVTIHHDGDFQLGADAVRARNEHRALHSAEVAREHSPERADVGDHPRRKNIPRQVANPFLRGIRSVDVDAGVFVCDAHRMYSAVRSYSFKLASHRSSCRSSAFPSGVISAKSNGYWPV